MSIKVIPTSRAMSDLQVIRQHVKTYNDAATARKTVNALLDGAERLGQDCFHRLGEEFDGYDDPPREVHRWMCLDGRCELHFEVLPPCADEPSAGATLRAGLPDKALVQTGSPGSSYVIVLSGLPFQPAPLTEGAAG